MKLRADHVAGAFFVAIGLLVAALSGDLPVGQLSMPGAGFLPFLCGLALIALGIVWRLQTLLLKSSPHVDHSADPMAAACEAAPVPLPGSRVKLVLALVATLAYAVLFERIGFFLATLVFMLGWQMVVERQGWLKSIIITALCTAAMYTLFRYLLHVELPSNPLLS